MIDFFCPAIPGAHVLDLYCGTGALGLEAMSSGAETVTFVEKDRLLCQRLKQILKQLDSEENAEVLCGEVLREMAALTRKGRSFEIIFADPPYEKGITQKLLERFVEHPLLKPQGWLLLETSKREELPVSVEDFKQVSTRLYGDTRMTYFRYLP